MAFASPSRSSPRPERSVADRLDDPSLHSAAMDLHVVGPLASPVERAAIESVTGPREPGFDGHGAQGRARGARSAPPPAAGAPRRPVARRLDQPAGAQRDLPPTERAARRGIRRGQLLRPALAQAAAAARRPRVRRHRLPRPRRRPTLRGAGTHARACRHTERRRLGDMAPEPLPRPLRAGAGGVGLERRRAFRPTRPSVPSSAAADLGCASHAWSRRRDAASAIGRQTAGRLGTNERGRGARSRPRPANPASAC